MAKKRSKKPKPLSDQIRDAVQNADASRYRICKDTGIDKATLYRFTSGERGLPMKTLDVLAEYLGLEITIRRSND